MIGAIIGGILGIGKTFLQNKGEEAKAKHESKIRKINADADWEDTMAKASADSWKDEFWTVILAIPLILVFFPQTRPWIEEGFKALQSSVPDWYLYALSVAIGAAFGVKSIMGTIKTLKKP